MRYSCRLLAVVLSACTAVAQNPPAPSGPPDTSTKLWGSELTRDQAAHIEKTLATSPEDSTSEGRHVQLIVYYYSLIEKRIDLANNRPNWARHLFWLIDHHPESFLFEFAFGFVPITFISPRRGPFPSVELSNESKKHWEKAVAEHPQDKVVLAHAASAFNAIDPTLALPLAKRVVELDPTCKECRGALGDMYGMAILGIDGDDETGPTCSAKAPDREQIVAPLRNELESIADSEVLVRAGSTLKGYSGTYRQRCGGNAEEAVQFGMMLVRKAVASDPSLIDRYKLQDILQSAPANAPFQPLPSSFRIAEKDAQARLVHEEPPVYPELARQAHVEGAVVLVISVDTEGRVSDAMLVSAHPLLYSAARDAVLKYRYKPLLVDGKPRPFMTQVRIVFSLP